SVLRAGSHVHEAHDHCRSAPGNTEDFHTVGDDVEQRFQVSQVVDTDCAGGVNALNNGGITRLRSASNVGGALKHWGLTLIYGLSLRTGNWILAGLGAGITSGERISTKLCICRSAN